MPIGTLVSIIWNFGFSQRVNQKYAMVRLDKELAAQRSMQILRDEQQQAAEKRRNSPFQNGDPSENREMLLRIYNQYQKPLLLIAPFWHTTQRTAEVDAGGGTHFRMDIEEAWRNAPWCDDFTALDGFFSRPFRNEHHDIEIVRKALLDLPIIIVHGYRDDEATRIRIATWNVIPGGEPYECTEIIGNAMMADSGSGVADRQFKAIVGDHVARMCGLLGTVYYYYTARRFPDIEGIYPDENFSNERTNAARWLTDIRGMHEQQLRDAIREVRHKLAQAKDTYVEDCAKKVAEKATAKSGLSIEKLPDEYYRDTIIRVLGEEAIALSIGVAKDIAPFMPPEVLGAELNASHRISLTDAEVVQTQSAFGAAELIGGAAGGGAALLLLGSTVFTGGLAAAVILPAVGGAKLVQFLKGSSPDKIAARFTRKAAAEYYPQIERRFSETLERTAGAFLLPQVCYTNS